MKTQCTIKDTDINESVERRRYIIEQLVLDDICDIKQGIANNENTWLRDIFKYGWTGYTYWSAKELEEELKNRSLE